MHKSDLWKILILAILTIVVRIGYFVEPPNLDQGVVSAVAKEIVDGKKLYLEIWDQRCPLIYYLYAFGYFLFGGNLWFFHLFEVANTVIAGILLYYLLCLVCDRTSATVAFFSYAVLFNHVFLGGWYSRAEPEVFFEIPVLLIFIIAHHMRTEGERIVRWGALGQGILWGLLVFLKLTAAPFVACVFIDYWSARQDKRWPSFLRKVGYFSLGSLSVIALFVLWFFYQQSLAAFWDSVFVYNFQYSQAGMHGWSLYLKLILWLLQSFVRTMPVLIMAFYGYSRYWPAEKRLNGLILWPFMALLGIIIQNKYWWYQLIPLITPALAMCAIGTASFLRKLRPSLSAKAEPIGILVSVVLLLPFGEQFHEYYQFHQIPQYLTGKISQEQFLATYRWSDRQLDILATWQASQHLKQMAQPGDQLFVLGFNGTLYLYSQLSCASQYPFLPQTPNDRCRDLVLGKIDHDLRRTNPRFIAIIKDDTLASIAEAKPLALVKLDAWIRQHYYLEQQFGDIDLLIRR